MEHHPISLLKEIIFPLVNFFGFGAILVYFFKKPVLNVFRTRSVYLEKSISEALKAHEDAKLQLETAKRKLEDIEVEKEQLTQNAEKEMKEFKRKSQEKIKELLAYLASEQDQKIFEEVKKATLKLKKDISQKIIATTETMFKKQLGMKDHDRLDDDFLHHSFSAVDTANKFNESKKRREIRSSTH